MPAMHKNKLYLLMIDTDEHFLAFGNIKSNEINREDTDDSPRFFILHVGTSVTQVAVISGLEVIILLR